MLSAFKKSMTTHALFANKTLGKIYFQMIHFRNKMDPWIIKIKSNNEIYYFFVCIVFFPLLFWFQLARSTWPVRIVNFVTLFFVNHLWNNDKFFVQNLVNLPRNCKFHPKINWFSPNWFVYVLILEQISPCQRSLNSFDIIAQIIVHCIFHWTKSCFGL